MMIPVSFKLSSNEQSKWYNEWQWNTRHKKNLEEEYAECIMEERKTTREGAKINVLKKPEENVMFNIKENNQECT